MDNTTHFGSPVGYGTRPSTPRRTSRAATQKLAGQHAADSQTISSAHVRRDRKRQGNRRITVTAMRETLLKDLAKYPLCNFFLRRCVEIMTDEQVNDDLAGEPDLSLLLHFDKPDQMERLEDLFARTMRTFGLSKEELKAQAEFNFDVYDMRGFESVRGVFRLANALSEIGFTKFEFLKGEGLADLTAIKDGQRWFIEVKTLVLQTKAEEIDVNGTMEVLEVDKFQPASRSIAEYADTVSKQVAGNLIEKARKQLLETVEKQGEAKKMVGIVLNLFAADFFLEPELPSTRKSVIAGPMASIDGSNVASFQCETQTALSPAGMVS